MRCATWSAPLATHPRRGHRVALVLERDREVGRVGDDDGGLRTAREHAAARHLALQAADAALDLGVAFVHLALRRLTSCLRHLQRLRQLLALQPVVGGGQRSRTRSARACHSSVARVLPRRARRRPPGVTRPSAARLDAAAAIDAAGDPRQRRRPRSATCTRSMPALRRHEPLEAVDGIQPLTSSSCSGFGATRSSRPARTRRRAPATTAVSITGPTMSASDAEIAGGDRRQLRRHHRAVRDVVDAGDSPDADAVGQRADHVRSRPTTASSAPPPAGRRPAGPCCARPGRASRASLRRLLVGCSVRSCETSSSQRNAAATCAASSKTGASDVWTTSGTTARVAASTARPMKSRSGAAITIRLSAARRATSGRARVRRRAARARPARRGGRRSTKTSAEHARHEPARARRSTPAARRSAARRRTRPARCSSWWWPSIDEEHHQRRALRVERAERRCCARRSAGRSSDGVGEADLEPAQVSGELGAGDQHAHDSASARPISSFAAAISVVDAGAEVGAAARPPAPARTRSGARQADADQRRREARRRTPARPSAACRAAPAGCRGAPARDRSISARTPAAAGSAARRSRRAGAASTGTSARTTTKIAAARGMKASTLSWIDVTVWKMLTSTPAIRPAAASAG